MKIFTMLTAVLLLPFFSSYSQSHLEDYRKISGRILEDESERPLAGVTLILKSSGESFITNDKGYFSFSLRNHLKDTLIVSYIGFKTMKIVVDDQTVLPLVIYFKRTSTNLGEVIVSTGYQKIPVERATGSFDKINNELLNREVSSDIISRLEGISSSVFFSKTAGSNNIYVRGLSTLSYDITSPLIVVDNFPYEGDIHDINPNDVESITILKDAAAASIWGARAGNGVIVITTKKGKYSQPFSLSFNSNITVRKKPDLFYDPSFLNSPDFIDVEKFLFEKGYYNATLNNVRMPVVSPVVEILAKHRSGLISDADADSYINSLRVNDVRKDYDKYLYRKAILQQYALSLSGGSDRINYLLSIGYDKNTGNLVGDKDNRITLHSVARAKPLSRLELQVGMNYAYSKTWNNGIGNIDPGGGKSGLYPYARLADQEGNSLAVPKDYRTGYVDTAGGGLLLDWRYRPLEELKFSDNTNDLQDVVLKMGINYEFTPSFSLHLNGQIEKVNREGRNYYSQETYFARNYINRYTQVNGTNIQHNIPLGGILHNSLDKTTAYAARGQLNYSKNWNNIHLLTAIAGAEVRQTHSLLRSEGVYGYDNKVLTFSNVDYVTRFQLYDKLGSAAIPNNNDFGDVLNRFVSIYSNIAYTYNNKYTLSGSVRKDASNLFGVMTNQKGVPLWSTGIAWKLSKEAFYHIHWLPVFRLRLTYGYGGNVRNDLASVPTIRYSGTNSWTNLPFAQLTNLSNPQLRWERVGMANAGIDFSTRNGRVRGSIEYFHKKAVDLLSFAPIDPTLGTGNMILNSANLSGKGFDIKIDAGILNGRFKWNMMVLMSFVTNKVTRYLLKNDNKGSYAGFGYTITPIEGKDPYALISYRWGGLDPKTGDPIGYIEGAKSSDYSTIVNTPQWNDLVISGTTRPPYYGNLLNTISWKRLTVSANIGFEFGYYFRRNSINYSALFSSWVAHKDFSRRWQEPGDEVHTNVPSMIYPANIYRDKFYLNSEATVEKGDLVRLKDINVSYNTGQIRVDGHPVVNLKLYFYANNVGILWRANKEGIDPDYGMGLPAPFSMSFGIRADF